MVKIARKKSLVSVMFFLMSVGDGMSAEEKFRIIAIDGKEIQNEFQLDEIKTLKEFRPEEEWYLPAGHEIEAITQNEIFSYNINTPVIATVKTPARCPKNGNVILPTKTRILGIAEILKSDDRVNIRFVTAVMPDGREFGISAIALAPSGAAGIKGEKKEYKDVRVMAGAMSGALTGVGQAVTSGMTGQPLAAGAITGGLQQASQQVQEISQQKVDVSITVPPFQGIRIFLMSRLALDDLVARPGTGSGSSQKLRKEIEKTDQKPKGWRDE